MEVSSSSPSRDVPVVSQYQSRKQLFKSSLSSQVPQGPQYQESELKLQVLQTLRILSCRLNHHPPQGRTLAEIVL